MGIDVAPMTVAWICFLIGTGLFSGLVGGFIEWNKAQKTIQQLNQDLRWAYQEADAVREELLACRSKRNIGSK